MPRTKRVSVPKKESLSAVTHLAISEASKRTGIDPDTLTIEAISVWEQYRGERLKNRKAEDAKKTVSATLGNLSKASVEDIADVARIIVTYAPNDDLREDVFFDRTLQELLIAVMILEQMQGGMCSLQMVTSLLADREAFVTRIAKAPTEVAGLAGFFMVMDPARQINVMNAARVRVENFLR